MKDLIPLYREMAATNRSFLGFSILQHKDQIGKLIKEHHVETLLDFGSGRGDAYKSPHKIHHGWGLKRQCVTLYDPAFPQYESKPPLGRMFDMVLCSDVLEHIPQEDVSLFLYDLFRRARKLVWASVCCRPAGKSFPGTEVNLHVTVQPLAWWQSQFDNLADYFPGVKYVLVETP